MSAKPQITGHRVPSFDLEIKRQLEATPLELQHPHQHNIASFYLPDDQESYTNLAATVSSTAIPGMERNSVYFLSEQLFLKQCWDQEFLDALSMVLTSTNRVTK